MSSPPKQPVSDESGTESSSASYRQILKSSSIVGGAEGVDYLLRMVQIKFVAILLGPAGVGLLGLYQSSLDLVRTFTSLGIASSGVREVAKAYGCSDPEKISQTVKTLRRASWVTGFFGWILTIALSYPLSFWIFGSGDRVWPITLLGITLLLSSVSGGQKALLQGVRRIGDLARLNVLSSMVGTVVAIALYALLGENGIVPVLITMAAFNLCTSWWFARKVGVVTVTQSFTETWQNSKRLIGLGLSFMWSGLLIAGVALAIRSLIVQQLGLDANGIYQAAWGISGIFAGFILGAMGADFYPRLTTVADDDTAVNKLVNEQTEIGILLALPGIIGTLAFSPWMLQIFFTSKFLPGADLLPWFAIGVFGRVISWPMGFIQLAKGAGRWFTATQSVYNVTHLTLSIVLFRWVGLLGIALAYAALHAFYVIALRWVSGRLSNFRWTPTVLRLFVASTLLVVTEFCVQRWILGLLGLAVGGILFAISGIFSLRGIASRLGEAHRLVKLACRIPGGRKVCGF